MGDQSSALHSAAQPAGKIAPPRRLPRRARSALVWGVVCAAALHAGVLLFVQRKPELRDPLFEERIKLLRNQLPDDGSMRPLLVVMIGTSRTGNGFDAKRAQDRLSTDLGRPVVVFNCGIAGIGPIAEQIYLRRLLAAGIRPDLVILEIMPIYYVEWGGIPFEVQALDANRVNRDEVELLAKYDVPIEPFRAQWREILLNPWGELRFLLLKGIWPEALPANALINWNSGCDPWGYRAIRIETVSPATYEDLNAFAYKEQGQYFADVQLGAPSLRALTDAAALCQSQSLPTLLVHMPEDSRFRSWYSADSIARIQGTFSQIANQHGCQWIEAFEWVPDGNFLDGHHLLERGSHLFTDRLTTQFILPRLRLIP